MYLAPSHISLVIYFFAVVLVLVDEGMLLCYRTPLPCRYNQVFIAPLYLPLLQKSPDAYRASLAMR